MPAPTKRERFDSRNNPSHSQNNPHQTPVPELLPTMYPSQENNRASLEMSHDGTTHGPGFADDGELGEVDEAC